MTMKRGYYDTEKITKASLLRFGFVVVDTYDDEDSGYEMEYTSCGKSMSMFVGDNGYICLNYPNIGSIKPANIGELRMILHLLKMLGT